MTANVFGNKFFVIMQQNKIPYEMVTVNKSTKNSPFNLKTKKKKNIEKQSELVTAFPQLAK